MSDKTFRSELIELIEKYEIGVMSNTPPRILAEKIEQDINVHNLITTQRDRATAKYIRVLESQIKDLEDVTKKYLEQ